jgi:GDSL-like Lipase/Acylhydrolase family
MSWVDNLKRLALLIGYYVVGLIALLFAVKYRSPVAVLITFGVFAVGGFFARRRIGNKYPGLPTKLVLGVTAALLFLTGAAIAIVGFAAQVSFTMYLVLAGVGMMFVVSGQYLGDLRKLAGSSTAIRQPLVLGLASAGVFVIGVLWLYIAPSPIAVLAMVAAMLSAPSGLSLLTGRVLSALAGAPPLTFGKVFLGGAVLALLGFAALNRMNLSSTYLGVLVVLTFLLVGAIASDTDLDTLAVVAFLGLIGSLAPAGVGADRETTPQDGDRVLVAIGDSYMSGEGAKEFYEGTNTIGKTDGQCRRAPTSYIVGIVAKSELLDSTVFTACSGALVTDLSDVADANGHRPQKQIPEAKEALAKIVNPTIDTVIISMSGNDAGFSDLAQTCLGPGDCSEMGAYWLDQLPSTAMRLATMYQDIETAFPDPAKLVMPYPVPISATGCSYSGFSDDEHTFLVGFVHELNAVVRQEAAVAGFRYMADNEGVFERSHLRICDQGDPNKTGVNFLAHAPADGLAADRMNPVNWIHNSLHPNKAGHDAIVTELLPYFSVIAPATERKPLPAIESAAAATWTPKTVDQLVGHPIRFCGGAAEPKYCPATSRSWTIVQAGLLFARGAGALVLLAGGSWLIWLCILALVRKI